MSAAPSSARHAPPALYGPTWLDTLAAWVLALLWILPLAYAFWTAFHPAEYSASPLKRRERNARRWRL
jgi:sn-glycerol 3-phosphate transport system permease protein